MAAEARTRATRAEETAQERRRRNPGTLDRMDHLKLAIPEHVERDNPDCVFRWIRDEPGRVHAMTKLDDWDRVEGVEPIPDTVGKSGQINLVLVKKRKDYWEEDQRRKQAAIKDHEKAILSATKNDPQGNPEAVSYVPEGNTITHGYSP